MNLGINGCVYNCGESCSGDCLSKTVTRIESSNIVCELVEYKYKVTWGEGGNQLCWFIPDVDGYYYVDFNTGSNGTLSSYALREISDALDVVNKPWDDHINAYFESQKDTPGKSFDDPIPF